MILTVDIGNTTITLNGVEKDGDDFQIVFSSKLDSLREKGPGYYERAIRDRLEKAEVEPEFDGYALSSVVPILTRPIRDAIFSLSGKRPYMIKCESNTGLVIDVPNPKGIGIDRIADSAWAADHLPLPVVTVDMGTATTINIINKEKHLLGGIIAPGVETSLNALSARAAQLPEIILDKPENLIGKNTIDCMLSGSLIGEAAMIDGLVERIEAELKEKVSLILTGGLAYYTEQFCLHTHYYDPFLLAKGIAYIYYLNN